MKVFGWILFVLGLALAALLAFTFIEADLRYRSEAKRARFLDLRPSVMSDWQSVEFPPNERQLLSVSHFGTGGGWDPGTYETGWVEIEILDRNGKTYLRERDWIGATSRVEPTPLASVHDPIEGPAILRARVVRPAPAAHDGTFRIHVNRVDPLDKPSLSLFLRDFAIMIGLALVLIFSGFSLLRRKAQPSKPAAADS